LPRNEVHHIVECVSDRIFFPDGWPDEQRWRS